MVYQKKEFAIGEEFQCGMVRLKVEKGKRKFSCKNCYIGELTRDCNIFTPIVGECMDCDRTDKTNVIFAKVEE